MRFAFLLLLLLLCGACAISRPQPPAPFDYQVELTPAGGDAWIATFEFGKPATAWLLTRTHPDLDGRPWRQAAWTIETPGVRLIQRDGHDMLYADGALLTTVRVRVLPHDVPLRADYVSILRFSDGGRAHYAGHYDVVPIPSPEVLDRTDDASSRENALPEARGSFSVADSGARMLSGGRAFQDRFEAPLEQTGYVYVGTAPLLETPALAAVVDPGLPEWMREELASFTPRLLAYHRDRLGEPAGGRPTVFAAWGGSRRKGVSLSGSVLDGLVVMELSGSGLAQPTAAARTRVRRFLAHETAHFWLGQTVAYAKREEAWITEGGADLLAARALQALDPAYNPLPDLQTAVDACPRLLPSGQSLNQAALNGEPRAAYACGAVLLLAVDAARGPEMAKDDAATFWNRLISTHRAEGEVDQDDWLAAFGKAVKSPAVAEDARRFVDGGTPDVTDFIRKLFESTGVPHRMEGDRVVLSGS